jgi:hypothetical protein
MFASNGAAYYGRFYRAMIFPGGPNYKENATLAAEIKDAPNIEDLLVPWLVGTTGFFPTGAPE